MSSFWMPKKQPLYAPMLSTFGGGSIRGFGGAGAAGGGGVDNSSIIMDFTWSSSAINGASVKESTNYRPTGNTEGFCVSNNGRWLIIFDYGDENIRKVDLSTNYNPAGGGTQTILIDMTTGGNQIGTNGRGGRFNVAGDTLYIATDNGIAIYSFNESNGSASIQNYYAYSGFPAAYGFAGNPRGLIFNPNPNGDEVLIQDASSQLFRRVKVTGQYSLSTATADATTYSFNNVSAPYFDGNYFTGAVLINDGAEIIVSTQNGRIATYSLSTNYDFSTVSNAPTNYHSTSLGNVTQNTRDLYVDPSGRLYSMSSSSQTCYRWTN